MTQKEILKQREKVLPELKALDKKFGAEVVHSAMRKHLTTFVERQKREKKIRQLRRELDALDAKLNAKK